MVELFIYAIASLVFCYICMEIGSKTKLRDLENVMAICCICSLVVTWIFAVQIFLKLMQ